MTSRLSKHLGSRYAVLVFATFVLGILIISQVKSYQIVENSLSRDSQTNIFQEIAIIKGKNDDLRREVIELEEDLEQLEDMDLALVVLTEEIAKYEKLSGQSPVFGPGLEVSINEDINTLWAIDIINELFNIGAQAVSLNDIRITNLTSGFDTLPRGQILLNGSILERPYTFKALGDGGSMRDILELPGGLFDRMEAIFPSAQIQTITKEILYMD